MWLKYKSFMSLDASVYTKLVRTFTTNKIWFLRINISQTMGRCLASPVKRI